MSGLLMVSIASTPPRPLALVAIGTSWKAEKFSTLTQDGQCVVKPQGMPDLRSLRAPASTSGQVFGASVSSSPAARNRSLLYERIGAAQLNGHDSLLPP